MTIMTVFGAILFCIASIIFALMGIWIILDILRDWPRRR